MKKVTMAFIVGDDGKQLIPFEDIDRFVIYHELFQNGSKLQAVIKEELCTTFPTKGLGTDWDNPIKGKYGYLASYTVLGKYNKHRGQIMSAVRKKGKIKTKKHLVRTSLNSGYTKETSNLQLKAEQVN